MTSIVHEPVGFHFGRRQIVGLMDRHLRESQLPSRQPAGVSADNYGITVDNYGAAFAYRLSDSLSAGVGVVVYRFDVDSLFLAVGHSGGVFGPAAKFIDRIRDEAERWAQPIAVRQVRFACTTLGGDAGLYGAGRLAMT